MFHKFALRLWQWPQSFWLETLLSVAILPKIPLVWSTWPLDKVFGTWWEPNTGSCGKVAALSLVSMKDKYSLLTWLDFAYVSNFTVHLAWPLLVRPLHVSVHFFISTWIIWVLVTFTIWYLPIPYFYAKMISVTHTIWLYNIENIVFMLLLNKEYYLLKNGFIQIPGCTF